MKMKKVKMKRGGSAKKTGGTKLKEALMKAGYKKGGSVKKKVVKSSYKKGGSVRKKK